MRAKPHYALVCGLLVSCGSKEGPVAPWLGGDFRGSQPLCLTVDQVEAETTFAHLVAMGSSPALLVGRDGGYEARALLRFPLPDSGVARYGSSTLTLAFQASPRPQWVRLRLYQVLQFWNESVVTWERANTDSAGNVPWDTPGGFLSPIALCEGGPSSLGGDTVRVEFSLPSQVTERLCRESGSSFGFAVVMVDEGVCQNLWRFHSREGPAGLWPSLKVCYTDTAGRDTCVTRSPVADATIGRRVMEWPQERLLVASGVGFRSLLKFSLPPILDSTVTISTANLVLTWDPSGTFSETKSVQAHVVEGDWRGDSTAVAATWVGQALLTATTPELTIPVTAAVRQWTRSPAQNRGLLLRFGAEDISLSCAALYGAGWGALSPRLVIYYTQPPRPPQAPGAGGST